MEKKTSSQKFQILLSTVPDNYLRPLLVNSSSFNNIKFTQGV